MIKVTLTTDKGVPITSLDDVVIPDGELAYISGRIDMTLAPGLYCQHITGSVFAYGDEDDAPLGLDLYRYLEVSEKSMRVLSGDEYSELAMPTTEFVDQYGRKRRVQFVELPAEAAPSEEVVEYTDAVLEPDPAAHDELMATTPASKEAP